jgi:acyl carrier protein
MQARQFTEDEVRQEIRNLIAAVTERSPDEILDSASFTDELGVDSLMAMEMMVAVDKKFKIDVPEEEFMKAVNVDEAVATVRRYLPSTEVVVA